MLPDQITCAVTAKEATLNDLNAMLATMGLPETGIWMPDRTDRAVGATPFRALLHAGYRQHQGPVVHSSIFSWLAYAVFLYITRKKANGDSQAVKTSG